MTEAKTQELAREALQLSKEKLEVYRRQTNGEYAGGPEYSALVVQIDRALQSLSVLTSRTEELERERDAARKLANTDFGTIAKGFVAKYNGEWPDSGSLRHMVEADIGALISDTTYGIFLEYDSMKSRATAAEAVAARLREALTQIVELSEAPFKFPVDWDQQIEACSECQRYKGHPIQRGICDTHRRPIYERERHDESEQKAIGYRAKTIARQALTPPPSRGEKDGDNFLLVSKQQPTGDRSTEQGAHPYAPLPWAIYEGHSPEPFAKKRSVWSPASEVIVANTNYMVPAYAEAYAEFIVRACNSYGDMLAALQQVEREQAAGLGSSYGETREQVRRAIAKAANTPLRSPVANSLSNEGAVVHESIGDKQHHVGDGQVHKPPKDTQYHTGNKYWLREEDDENNEEGA